MVWVGGWGDCVVFALALLYDSHAIHPAIARRVWPQFEWCVAVDLNLVVALRCLTHALHKQGVAASSHVEGGPR
jgi:hypothetical protein